MFVFLNEGAGCVLEGRKLGCKSPNGESCSRGDTHSVVEEPSHFSCSVLAQCCSAKKGKAEPGQRDEMDICRILIICWNMEK